MHLRSVSLKGFKSFPDRTTLEFGPGVAVVVGPNGSGKSNVTDAILWALGEQSPLAVRGQRMQDVIFGGGRGVGARQAAEVELVLDNADGAVDLPVGEISILRRLDRSGEGEYRLNGARCRLSDVQEVLSDTGLGKEAHSVVSQGRVEAIVTSRPRDRRLLIEEAAGLGKHRRRRRRAQLKLDRTSENLEQALAVEHESRRRLAPLKRQAEAAELHERLQRQQDEARGELLADRLRARRAAGAAADAEVTASREELLAVDAAAAEVGEQRRAAEEALSKQAAHRDRLAQRARQAESAAERVELRLERATEQARASAERLERRSAQRDALRAEAEADRPDERGAERVAALEAELTELAAAAETEREHELAALAAAHAGVVSRVTEAGGVVAEREGAVRTAAAEAEAARGRRRELTTAAEAARRESAAVGAELARANQFLRSHGGGAPGGGAALADELEVAAGAELAVSAALDGRLQAALVADVAAGRVVLRGAGRDGGRAIVTGAGAAEPPVGAAPPVPGAAALVERVRGDTAAARAARALLADAWLVAELPDAPPVGAATLVTPEGLVWRGALGELQQAASGGDERVLAERNRRERLLREVERTATAEANAQRALEGLADERAAADRVRDEADAALRTARAAAADVQEEARQAERAHARRRDQPEEGPRAVRAAQLRGELAAERRGAERAARERADRERRAGYLDRQVAALAGVPGVARALAGELDGLLHALRARAAAFAAEVTADREAGEDHGATLRDCATREAELAQRRREGSERLTRAEVGAQRARDQAADALAGLRALAERLGFDPSVGADDREPLPEERVAELERTLERLQRRREQLGPVNPLAQAEYDEARAHVEELERQRGDLEQALRELRTFVRDTDREIEETFTRTFDACATNFADLAGHVFPGGSGRLRLVRESDGGDAERVEGEADDAEAADADGADAQRGDDAAEDVGVEIEITPAGKRTTRLSLLSGGEKSMTAIAFLFSVFLARPCPFYVLDEVEAALDDPNIDRFLALLRQYREQAQFLVVTHQKRTMEVADVLYGVSMGGDGVSKVVSQRLPREGAAA